MQQTSWPGARVDARHAVVEVVGTWESTAQATWASSPAAASISIDSAPTPAPNSIFRTEASTVTYSSTTPITDTEHGLALSPSPCSTCEATATAPAHILDDGGQQSSQQVPVILTVVILSCLILVLLLVLGWLRFRRRRRIKQELDGGCLRNDSNASGLSQEKPRRADSSVRLTGPTLVPDATLSMRTLLTLSPHVYDAGHLMPRMLRDPRYSSSTIEDCHPAFMPPPTRALPPTPPPKARLAPKALPSSPSISARSEMAKRRSSRKMDALAIVRLSPSDMHRVSTASPRSDTPDSPTVGFNDIRNASRDSSPASSVRSGPPLP